MPPRYHDAASVHVGVPPERVENLLSDPDLLRALDDRFLDASLAIQRSGDKVEVRDEEGRVHVAFRLAAEGEGTRVAALEDVEPDGILEATKRMFMPGRTHEEFEDELDRLRVLLESME